MLNLKTKIILFSIALAGLIVWLFSPDQDAEEKKKYLQALDLSITGIVKKVMPLRDEDHGYGVIYLNHFSSNKKEGYESAFKTVYVFCRLKRNEAIIVTPGVTKIEPNDSVEYNTNTLSYRIFRNGQTIVENGIAINDDDTFYRTLTSNGYLDFSYFNKN